VSTARELPLRILLAVGDRELERRLAGELPESGIVVAGRCLDGPSLLERAPEPGIDAILAAADLHRLTETTLETLRDRRLRVVLLAGAGEDAARLALLASVVPASSSGAVIAAALRAESAAIRHSDLGTARGKDEASASTDSLARVIAVASGKGAPGKTTIAIALASSLAASGHSTVLVDADLRGGNVAPYLDLDPRRGLVGLASAAGPLAGRLAAELQEGPGFAVLAGVERPELAISLSDDVLGSTVAALRDRFARVVVDLGAPAAPPLLRGSEEVLLVSGADLVSVWNARIGLRAISEGAGGAVITALVNRREGREHYDREEIERALGIPVLGVVREDRKAARRATAKQIPLSLAGGRAARDLRAISAALEAGRELTPAERDAEHLLSGAAGR